MRPGSIILTQEGMVFGTPEFMSPEQAQGKTLTPASDIYSIATILYEVLTGKLPFDAKSAMDYIQLHVMAKPIPLNQRVPGRTFPLLLEQIIDRALAKPPEDRFTSAAEFAQALQAVLQGSTQLPANLQLQSDAATVPAGHIASADVARAVAQQRAAAPQASPYAQSPLPPTSTPIGQVAQRPAASLRSSAPAKASVGLLLGVAAAFLAIGVLIAIVAMKFLR
jgi:serine/threonine-protein kinase